MKKNPLEIHSEDIQQDAPLYPIGIAAELVGTSKQTLRLYERHNLIVPTRRNKNRFYSKNDIKWIQCLRELLHTQKISIEGIKKLLSYAPCWEITKCSHEIREQCSAYIDRTIPCWKLNKMICKSESGKTCEDCFVFLSKAPEKKTKD